MKSECYSCERLTLHKLDMNYTFVYLPKHFHGNEVSLQFICEKCGNHKFIIFTEKLMFKEKKDDNL